MYKLFKRIFDILVGIFGLIILLPLSIMVKISFMLLRDSGSVFYKQKRVGEGGKIFKIYKFRTMVQNAEELLEELLKDEKYRKEWEENQKLDDDPRITSLGKYFRKTSLDELPQLLNVLKGDMSLVGPRPLVEGELEMHGGTELYWKAKPGITGWWASHGRSDVNYNERLEMEYYYIQNQSMKLDVICICKTVLAVLGHKGAK